MKQWFPFSQKSDPKASKLMLLPGEIRLQILYHLLVHYARTYDTRRCRSQGVAWKVTGEYAEVSNAGFSGLSAQILRVSRQLYSEGLPLLYGENAFSLEAFENRCLGPETTAPWTRIFGDNVRLVHHIDVIDLKLRYLGPVFPMSSKNLFPSFLDRAQALTSMRILVTEIYNVPSFDKSDFLMVTDATTEAQNRCVNEMYQISVILEASRLLKAAGWQSCHWYEAKERYYVEPVFYVARHPLTKLPKTLDNKSPDAPTFLPLEIDYEHSKVRRIGGPHTEYLGDLYVHNLESDSSIWRDQPPSVH